MSVRLLRDGSTVRALFSSVTCLAKLQYSGVSVYISAKCILRQTACCEHKVWDKALRGRGKNEPLLISHVTRCYWLRGHHHKLLTGGTPVFSCYFFRLEANCTQRMNK